MTVGGEDHLVRAGDAVDQHSDQVGAFARGGVADGVGDVDRGGARLDGDFHHPAQIVVFGARRIHGRPLHIVAEVAGVGHGLVDAVGHLVHGQVRNGAVQRRGADEGVDAGASGVADRFPVAIDVLEVGTGQAADHGILRVLRDFGDSVEIAFGRDREAGLDDVHAHLVEHGGDLQLLLMGHGRAGGLFAIAERRVEDQDVVLFCRGGHGVLFLNPGAMARDGCPLSGRADPARSEAD